MIVIELENLHFSLCVVVLYSYQSIHILICAIRRKVGSMPEIAAARGNGGAKSNLWQNCRYSSTRRELRYQLGALYVVGTAPKRCQLASLCIVGRCIILMCMCTFDDLLLATKPPPPSIHPPPNRIQLSSMQLWA